MTVTDDDKMPIGHNSLLLPRFHEAWDRLEGIGATLGEESGEGGGESPGSTVGAAVGSTVGAAVGGTVGAAVGAAVGSTVERGEPVSPAHPAPSVVWKA